MLYKVNEKGTFRDPENVGDTKYIRFPGMPPRDVWKEMAEEERIKAFLIWQDEEIFQLSRHVNCGHFIK